MRADLSDVTKKYTVNQGKLEILQDKIYVNKTKLNKATADLKVNQRNLNKRVGSLYRYDQTTILDVVLSAKSWNDFLVSWDFINRIGKKDARVIAKIKRLRIQINQAQQELAVAEKNQSNIVDDVESEKQELESGLEKQKAMMAGIESELEELSRIPKAVPTSAGPSVAGANGWVFPVAAPYSFSDTWGAPRRGHTHQGTDIMCSYGAATYAVVSGSVSNQSGGSAGLWQSLHGNDGNTYYYMHQSGFAASGAVSQGQVIGYAGNSGNASGGAPHVHFEFHPGGGGAVNPYPYLVAAQ